MTTDDKPKTPEVLKIRCEVYSRVVGYLRPVDAWNEGKRQEFKERVTYQLPKERSEG